MRANEFIVEGIFDKIGNAAHKSVIKQKQGERASVLKKNLPGITTAVQRQLAFHVGKLLKSGSNPALLKSKLSTLVSTLMSKLLKVKVEADSPEVKQLLQAISQNPNEIQTDATITKIVQDIIVNSMKKDQDLSLSDKEALTKIADKIISDVGEDSNKVADAVRTVFKDNQVGADITATASAIKARMDTGIKTKKAVYDVIVDDKDGLMSNQATAQAEPEPEPEEEPGEDSPEETSTGISIVALKDAIKEALLGAHDDIYNDRDYAADYVHKQLQRNGMKNEDLIADVTDEIMQDPDMPFNFKPESQFKGLTYSPGGIKYKQGDIDGNNIAFVKHKDRWSEWVIAPRNIWKYNGLVPSPRESALDALADAPTDEVGSLIFRQDSTEGAEGMYKVSTR